MAISDTQKVDYLWKKLGFGVAKTDTPAKKEAINENIASPLLIRGDTLWAQSSSIPASIPATSSSVVTVYKDGTGSFQPTVQCTLDTSATTNRTWLTNSTNWIPAEFGSTYLVKVYLATTGVTNPQTSGSQLFAAGSGNNDEWFFDYQAGVLNFIGTNLPSLSFTGKSIFITGARYTGDIGVGTVPNLDVSGSANIGNLAISGNTISSSDANGDVVFAPTGTGNVVFDTANAILGNAATANFFIGSGNNLSNIQAANITGTVANANYAAYAGNVTIAAQANITSLGTLTGLIVNGTSNLGSNSNVIIAGGNVGSFLSTDGLGNLLWSVPGSVGVAGSNTQVQFNDSDAFAGNSNFTFDKTTSTLTVTNISANGAALTSLPGANVTGVVANANYAAFAGDIVNSSQSNITSVGTLSNLSVSGNITSSGFNGNSIVSDRTPVSVTTDSVIDQFAVNQYRSAKYTIRAGNEVDFQSIEVLLVHDSSNSYITVYGSISSSGTEIVTISSTVDSGNVKLLATAVGIDTTVNLMGTYVKD